MLRIARVPSKHTVSLALALVGLGCMAVAVAQNAQSAVPEHQASPPATLGNPNNESYASKFLAEYESWKATKDAKPNTLYGGSGYRDYLAEHPNLVVLWAGYPFSLDYNQARGHYHALEDV